MEIAELLFGGSGFIAMGWDFGSKPSTATTHLMLLHVLARGLAQSELRPG